MDIAPTLLDIVGVPRKDWPPFFDGRSLLAEWRTRSTPDDGIAREVLNVEFWGSTTLPAGRWTRHLPDNSYKSLRIVGDTKGYLFNRWCFGNFTELYDTVADPGELRNLAVEEPVAEETRRLMARLGGLLLVTKSCGRESCRRPWTVLREAYVASDYFAGNTAETTTTFDSLAAAMDPAYDDFFASLPHFGFRECLPFQSVENEGPYYPPESASLGKEFRELVVEDEAFWRENMPVGNGLAEFASDEMVLGGKRSVLGRAGSEEQRFASWEDVMLDARVLSQEELRVERREEEVRGDCGPPDYCGQVFVHDDM